MSAARQEASSGFRSLRLWLLIGVAAIIGIPGVSSCMHWVSTPADFPRNATHIYRTSDLKSFIFSDRVGSMEAAPAYITCANTIEYYRRRKTSAELDPRFIRGIVRRQGNAVSYASTVGPFLICVLDHNPTNVCDRDNRALAIEAVNRYLRATDAISEHVTSRPYWTIPVKVGEVLRQRDRILVMLREHARDGRLTKRDFGLLQHPEIIKIFETTTAISDRCARI